MQNLIDLEKNALHLDKQSVNWTSEVNRWITPEDMNGHPFYNLGSLNNSDETLTDHLRPTHSTPLKIDHQLKSPISGISKVTKTPVISSNVGSVMSPPPGFKALHNDVICSHRRSQSVPVLSLHRDSSTAHPATASQPLSVSLDVGGAPQPGSTVSHTRPSPATVSQPLNTVSLAPPTVSLPLSTVSLDPVSHHPPSASQPLSTVSLTPPTVSLPLRLSHSTL